MTSSIITTHNLSLSFGKTCLSSSIYLENSLSVIHLKANVQMNLPIKHLRNIFIVSSTPHMMVRLTFYSSQKPLIIRTCCREKHSLRLRIMCGCKKQHKHHHALQKHGLSTYWSIQNITVSNQWECLCLIKVYSFDLSAVGRAEDCSVRWNP